MNSRPLLHIILGFLLGLGGGGCTPRYHAKATVEYPVPRSPGGPGGPRLGNDAPSDASAEQAIRALLPKDDPAVTLHRIPNTKLYEIGVNDPDPLHAAQRANELATMLSTRLNPDPHEQPFRGLGFRIWEWAVAPTRPSR